MPIVNLCLIKKVLAFLQVLIRQSLLTEQFVWLTFALLIKYFVESTFAAITAADALGFVCITDLHLETDIFDYSFCCIAQAQPDWKDFEILPHTILFRPGLS